MQQTITLTIPDVLNKHYSSQKKLEKLLYEAMIVEAYQEGHLSIRQCANLLGFTYEAFILWLGKRRVPLGVYEKQEQINQDAIFETFLSHYNDSQKK